MISLYYFILSWHIVFLWKRRNEVGIIEGSSSVPSRMLSIKRKRNRHQPLDTEESSPDLPLTTDNDDQVDYSTLPYNDHPNNAMELHRESSTEDLQLLSHSFFGLFPMHKPMLQYCILALIMSKPMQLLFYPSDTPP
mmetsp:Transcript_13344/g.32046  ORF Transcript_13344/g.32046 Transcript_13344/m.32046 type:complete len:137 (+) Transcript_13344:2300-2710(+)